MIPPGLRRFAWANLAWNLGVILWGAYVRATGSGAGCGEHWPACNGAIVPRDPSIETLIEYTHRLTSGLALVGVVVLAIWARRSVERGHPVRRAAFASLVLMCVEALLGAGLVLFRLVADDDSHARAVAMALHLVNTLLLVGALTLTAWWSAVGGRGLTLRGRGVAGTLMTASLTGMLVLGASGALAALGNTLFPEAKGLEAHLAPTAHVALQLAVFHPIIAVAVAILVLATAGWIAATRRDARSRRLAAGVAALFVVQVGAGVLNIFLMAPIWLQLVHLLLADLIWIGLVCLAAESFARASEAVAAPEGAWSPAAR